MAAGEPIVQMFPEPPHTPVPEAVLLGSVLYVPALTGRDPVGGRLAPGFQEQLRQALDNLESALGRAGATLAHLGHVTICLADLALRPTLNQLWAERFPDPDDRPPHKYVPVSFPDDRLVQLQAFAVPAGTREVLAIPGMQHMDPMSMGATIDNLLFSSRIVGTDPRKGRTSEEPQEQAEQALRNVRMLLEQAGSGPASLTQVAAFVSDPGYRPFVERSWERMFPGPPERPGLHFLVTNLLGATVIRLEIVGVLSGNP